MPQMQDEEAEEEEGQTKLNKWWKKKNRFRQNDNVD